MNLFALATLWFIVGAAVYAFTEVTLASIKAKVEIERIRLEIYKNESEKKST